MPLSALVMAACHPAAGDAPVIGQQEASSVPIPRASRSPTDPTSEPDALRDYRLLKAVYRAGGGTPLPRPSGQPIDLVSCAGRDALYQQAPPADQAMENVARDVVDLAVTLDAAGFPAALSRAPLADYEQARLAAVLPGTPRTGGCDGGDRACDDRLRQRLAERLQAARQASGRALPAIVADGGCGAGEQPIRVVTAPAGGRVWFITDFSFRLCAARRQDPWDRTRCDRWRELAPDRTAELSGSYRYQAQWPNGARGRGERLIEGGDDVDDVATITVGPG